MNAIKRNIPNIITLANLMCGLLAIFSAIQGNIAIASLWIFAGAFFDFFDGLAARLLNVSGEFGKQLDSMADMVTFGVAPGMILFQLIDSTIFNTFEILNNSLNQSDISQPDFFPSLIAFLIPLFSAIRLAKFNIDTRQTTSFIGLPTPVAAIFIASFPMIGKEYGIWLSTELLIGVTVILSLLLVAEIPLFSLKISQEESLFSRLNIFRIILILSAVLLLFVFQFAAIPFIVILYLILSLLNNIL